MRKKLSARLPETKLLRPQCNTHLDTFSSKPQNLRHSLEESKKTGNLCKRTCINSTDSKRHERKTKKAQASRRHNEPREKIFRLQTRNTGPSVETPTSRRKTQKTGCKTTHLLKILYLRTKVSVYSELPWSRNPCRSELHEVSLDCKTLGTHSKEQQVRLYKHRWRRKRSKDLR